MPDRGYPIDLVNIMLFSYCTRMKEVLLTSGEVLFRHLGNAFGKHNSETPEKMAAVSGKSA